MVYRHDLETATTTHVSKLAYVIILDQSNIFAHAKYRRFGQEIQTNQTRTETNGPVGHISSQVGRKVHSPNSLII